MRSIAWIALSLIALGNLGCGDSVQIIAETVLYPFDRVDEKYPVPENPPEGLNQKYFDLTASDGTAMKVHAWYHRAPNSRAKTFVHFHGNGENLEAMNQSNFLKVLMDMKVNFVIIDYPGLGRSTGFPDQQNLTNAGLASLHFAKQIFSRSKIVVWGRSLGAAVAAQVVAANSSGVEAMLLTSPWSSFLDVAKNKTGLANRLPQEWLDRHNYDSVEAASRIRVNSLIHHGIEDTLIPVEFGRRVFESFPNNNADMVEIPEVGHNDIYMARQFWDDLKSFEGREESSIARLGEL